MVRSRMNKYVFLTEDREHAEVIEDVKWLVRRAPRQWPIRLFRSNNRLRLEGDMNGLRWLKRRLPIGCELSSS